MLPDTCDLDIFEAAYTNIGLCSDIVWTKNAPDIYKRINRELWIRTNRLREYFTFLETKDRSSDNKTFTTRTVRDTIPLSNLAKYGNYKYDEHRENLYITDESEIIYDHIYESSKDSKEPWMCPSVEEEFRRLTNVSSVDTKT
ncbi:hypothetical protein R5R35_001390 [Gryllus longicercus]|uniref:Uncharacterized protein n=1 Tax=Gryllus longicercus TaxID=2509291 RepID=A0AAN9VZH2_9ORTH